MSEANSSAAILSFLQGLDSKVDNLAGSIGALKAEMATERSEREKMAADIAGLKGGGGAIDVAKLTADIAADMARREAAAKAEAEAAKVAKENYSYSFTSEDLAALRFTRKGDGSYPSAAVNKLFAESGRDKLPTGTKRVWHVPATGGALV